MGRSYGTAERRASVRLDDIDGSFSEIDGRSAEIRRLKREMAAVAADPDVTVLISGESGTGKERVARAIHHASKRRLAPFVVIDCAGLPPTLAEDTLFGHARGAFTGATQDRAGPFERAGDGVVFLDEIGDLPLELQMKLLRVLQSRRVVRLGCTQEIAINARFLAATNVDLDRAVANGRFREDLFYRLKVFDLRLPPLRRRGREDVEALFASLLQALSARRGRRAPEVEPAAMEVLIRYEWPGNVRELENTIERMLVAAMGGTCLYLHHLPDHIVRAAAIRLVRRGRPPDPVEIRTALEQHGFRLRAVAMQLSLSRHQLYRLMKRYGIAERRSCERPTAEAWRGRDSSSAGCNQS